MSRHHKHYTGIRNGLWTWEHIRRLGPALGLFGWCVSRQTAQNGSVGLVFGGQPVTLERICDDLEGAPRRSVERWLMILRREGYIDVRRVQYGVVIRVLNAKKHKWVQRGLFSDTPEVAHLGGSDTPEVAGQIRQKRRICHDKSGVSEAAVLSIETKRESKREKQRALELPDWLPKDAWKDYREMRQRIRKPMTPRAEQMALRRLEELRADSQEPRAVLEQSVFNSWQGLFPVKETKHGRSKAEERELRNLKAAGLL